MNRVLVPLTDISRWPDFLLITNTPETFERIIGPPLKEHYDA
jgi:hypothetical protein